MRQEQVPIVSNENVGEETYVIRLRSDRLARESNPGQFLHVRVTDSLDPILRRPLSIHRLYPDTGEIDILYKLKGKGTRLLAERDAEGTIDVIGPLGNGFPQPTGTIHLIAGGMGVAPLAAVIDNMPDGSRKNVTSFIGARTASALLCADEFRSLGVEVKIATEDGTEGHHGFVSDLAMSLAVPDTIFCCGPNGMTRAIVRYALEKNITCCASVEERMACGVGICRACAILLTGPEGTHYGRVCADGPVFPAEQLSEWAGEESLSDTSRR